MSLHDESADAVSNSLHYLASHACPLTDPAGVQVFAAAADQVHTVRVDDGGNLTWDGIKAIVAAADPVRNGYAIMTRLPDSERHLIAVIVDRTVSLRTVDREGLDRVDIDIAADRDAAADHADRGLVSALIAALRAAGRWTGATPWSAA